MKLTASVFAAVAVFVTACGGGADVPISAAQPNILQQLQAAKPTKMAALQGTNGIAINLYQALYGKAPSNPMLVGYVNQIGTSDSYAWANGMAASFSSMSNSDFSTMVLNNISITPTSLNLTATFGTSAKAYNALQSALADYFNAAGLAQRGTVVLQLATILAGMENETQFGVYGNAAIAFNKQTAANNSYSSNAANAVSATVPVGPTASLVAGTYARGYVNGTGTAASFNAPAGIAIDNLGNMFVADSGNYVIRKITAAGIVSTFAGSGTTGSADGVGTAASFGNPQGLAVDSSGNLYVADSGNANIRKISPAGVVSTFAGKGAPGWKADWPSVTSANAIAIDSKGNLLVTTAQRAILKIDPNGVVSVFAGHPTMSGGFVNGVGADASFYFGGNPQTLAADSSGNVYVADLGNQVIRKITSGGVVSTFASILDCLSIATDSSGNLFVVDEHVIRRITPAGVVSTFADNSAPGMVGVGYGLGMAVDSTGNVFVADITQHVIRKITPQ